MSAASLASYLYYSRVSNPSHERIIYQWIRRKQATRFVELGVGRAVRSTRIIAVAQRYAAGRRVHYTGIDLFESREGGRSGLSLKLAFRALRPLDVQLRLAPGDPFAALSRYANYLAETDIVVISADQNMGPRDEAWSYLPRMLHQQSVVLVEQRTDRGLEMKVMHTAQIESIARQNMRCRRLAA